MEWTERATYLSATLQRVVLYLKWNRFLSVAAAAAAAAFLSTTAAVLAAAEQGEGWRVAVRAACCISEATRHGAELNVHTEVATPGSDLFPASRGPPPPPGIPVRLLKR